jgi:hypothetical protein
MSRNMHINLFKHSAGLSFCLSKAEEREPGASQPIQMIRLSLFLVGGMSTIQLILTSPNRRGASKGERKDHSPHHKVAQ